MIQEFNDLPWHDAELIEIIIDRSRKDNVRLLIKWPEEYGGIRVSIEFYSCYGLEANMHFGIVPPDFILEAECISQSLKLDDIKKTWKQMGLDLTELYCFRITTNSTNSTINIFSRGFQMKEAGL